MPNNILETLCNDPNLLVRRKVPKPRTLKQKPRNRLESIIDKIISKTNTFLLTFKIRIFQDKRVLRIIKRIIREVNG